MINSLSRGLPRSKVPSRRRENKLFRRDIPGILLGYSGFLWGSSNSLCNHVDDPCSKLFEDGKGDGAKRAILGPQKS